MIVNYTDIENQIKHILSNINTNYDHIVGMYRGGLIPSVHLSHKLNIPIKIADISHELSKGDNLHEHENYAPNIADNAQILIVDDILDSGYTINECLNRLNIEKADVAVLYAKESGIKLINQNPKLNKLFYAELLPDDAPFIYFPWE